jgi:hypothetical protein
VSVICLIARWIINLFLIFSRISFLTFLFSFHFLFRLNLTMYEHFLNECISSHIHLSFFFWFWLIEWLCFLLLHLLLCSFWLNDSFWVTSCSVAALAVARNDDDWFSRIIVIRYALMILKNSTDFSAASNWFSHVSQNVNAHRRPARRNSLTKMTSSPNVPAKFKLIICRRKFSHSAIHDSILLLTERVFNLRHCSWICSIIFDWFNL